MSEEPELGGDGRETVSPDAPHTVRTGMDSVDAVISAVEQLEERPLEEHVGVFESAHEQLRRALDHQSADPA